MPAVLHPVADSWPADLLVYESRAQTVVLSAALSGFLDDVETSDRRPVLLTPATSRITWAVADRLRRAGGMWAFRDSSGSLYSALSGYEVQELTELWEEPASDSRRHEAFTRKPFAGHACLSVDIYARQRADSGTVIGELGDTFLQDLDLPELAAWGVHEPATRRWNPAAMTRSIQEQMPASRPHLAVNGYNSALSTTVARTRTGLLENTRGLIWIGDYEMHRKLGGAAHIARHEPVNRALTRLAEDFRPTVAMVSLAHPVQTDYGLGQRAASRWPDEPAAVLIGAWAVRDLGLDVDDLARKHDVEHVGSRRAPSVLLRLSGPDPVWAQFVAFAHDLDEERLASALAVDFERADRGRS